MTQDPKTPPVLQKSIITNAIPTLMGYLFIGVIVYTVSDTFSNWVNNHWIVITIGVVLILVALVAIWAKNAESAKRTLGLTIYVALPILFVLGMALLILPPVYHIPLLRSIFVLIVCFLPATMYYLFIASRKRSLLQEYFSNLSRLGLFERQPLGGGAGSESELERRVRVMSYIQKFEAAYGPIPPPVAGAIVDVTDPDNHAADPPEFHQYSAAVAMGEIFTPETSIPVVLATLLIGLGWLLTLPPWQTFTGKELGSIRLVLQPDESVVHYAFLGAYFFALQMLFRRYVRKDLRANAYLSASVRIILAVIGIWAVIQVADILNIGEPLQENETGAVSKTEAVKQGTSQQGDDAPSSALLVVGFVIGAFPPVAWQVLQAAFRKVTFARFLVPSVDSEMPVSDLDGLTVWHQARLEEEDIENVPNMATADMIELMLNTRIPPDRIVDWVDQAILYTQLGPIPRDKNAHKTPGSNHRKRLREYGIRTGSDLLVAFQRATNNHEDTDKLENILPGDGPSRVRGMVDTLDTNVNLGLVLRWRRLNIHQTESGVRIVALRPNPVGADRGNEEVTIRNNSNRQVSLDGWHLKNKAGRTFALSGIVGAGQERTMRLDPATMTLSDKGDTIQLLGPKSRLIDQLQYDESDVSEGGIIRYVRNRVT